MVMNKSSKTKSKAPTKKAAASKKTQLPSTSNGNDLEEPQDTIETNSDIVDENIGEAAETAANGSEPNLDNGNHQVSNGGDSETVKSQKKTNSKKEIVNAEEEKSTLPPPKAKGRQKKEKKMEITEETPEVETPSESNAEPVQSTANGKSKNKKAAAEAENVNAEKKIEVTEKAPEIETLSESNAEPVQSTASGKEKKIEVTEEAPETETPSECNAEPVQSTATGRSRNKKAASKSENVNAEKKIEAPEIETPSESIAEPVQSTVTGKTRKRKAAAEAEGANVEKKIGATEKTPDVSAASENTSEPVEPITVKSRKRKAAVETETTEQNVSEDNTEAVAGSSTSTTRSRTKRKAASATKTPSEAKSQSIKGKKTVSAPVTKAKRQKVVLDVPPVPSVKGKVFVMGENDVGQLGLQDVELKKRPAHLNEKLNFVDIAAGGMHSVCLTDKGEVITFGCNDEGALGRITTDDSLEGKPLKVELPEGVVQISAGDSHSAALTVSGHVYLWGNFRSGDGPMGLTPKGVKQTTPVRILNDIIIVKISSGTEHLACLSNDGLIYTLGCGENGQLGRIPKHSCHNGGRRGLASLLIPAQVHIGNKSVPIEDVWTGSYNTFIKSQGTGSIYAFGLNNYQQLGCEKTDDEDNVRYAPKHITSFNEKTWLRIAGGQHHSLALDEEGLVYSLGRAEYGRLGLGEGCGEKSVPTVIPTFQNEKCKEISCGNCVSFGLSEEGSIYSWGMGDNHQLGHGNDEDCHVPKRIDGNFFNSWKAHKVSGGGQHTLILAVPREDPKK